MKYYIPILLVILLLSLMPVPASTASSGGAQITIYVTDHRGYPVSGDEYMVINAQNGNVTTMGNLSANGSATLFLEEGYYNIYIVINGSEIRLNTQGYIRVSSEGSITYDERFYGNGSTIVFHFGDKGSGASADNAPNRIPKESLDNSICILPFIVFILLVIIAAAAGYNYSRIHGHETLNNITRRRIMNYIEANPGIHFRAMQRDLGIGSGTLTHHLHKLEAEEFVKSESDGQMRHYYPAGMKVQPTIHLNLTQQKILYTIKANPGITPSEIAHKTGLTKKVAYYNVSVLANAGLVAVEKDGRAKRCYSISG